MKIVNLHAAKTHLSRLVDDAARGEDVVIAKAGRPIVRLVPVSAGRKRRRAGTMKGKIRIGKDFDAPLPDDLARAFGVKR
jgi:prevent-host-death family protein